MIVSKTEKWWWECIITGWCTVCTGDNSITGETDKCTPGVEWND